MSKNTVTVSEKGAIVIPKELRKRFGLEPGDRVHVYESEGRLVLMPATKGDPVARWAGAFAGPGPSLTDRLIEEHRREVAEEEREYQEYIERRKRSERGE